MPIDIASEDGMSKGITCCLHLPTAVDKGMAVLSSKYGIEHHRDVTTGGILHSNGYINAAGCKAMLLVFDASCPYGHIRQKIGKVAVIIRIQHLVCCGKTGVFQNVSVEAADRDQAFKHIACFSGFG